jgi:hypothetical protein
VRIDVLENDDLGNPPATITEMHFDDASLVPFACERFAVEGYVECQLDGAGFVNFSYTITNAAGSSTTYVDFRA